MGWQGLAGWPPRHEIHWLAGWQCAVHKRHLIFMSHTPTLSYYDAGFHKLEANPMEHAGPRRSSRRLDFDSTSKEAFQHRTFSAHLASHQPSRHHAVDPRCDIARPPPSPLQDAYATLVRRLHPKMVPIFVGVIGR